MIEIRAEMRDYLVDKATGRVAQGDKTLGTSTTVWSFAHEDGRWLLSNIEPEGPETGSGLGAPRRLRLYARNPRDACTITSSEERRYNALPPEVNA